MRKLLAGSLLPIALAVASRAEALTETAIAGQVVPGSHGAIDLAAATEVDSVHVDSVHKGLTGGDWTSIRAAHEAWQRGVVATAEGHGARHPAQRWHSAFDGRGVTITPAEGAWSWGLELERWGCESALQEVDGVAAGCALGERVEYDWDASLSEWYVNGASGLEHGYTVYRRPEGHRRPAGEGALVLELAVRGTLAPEIDACGRGARFVNRSGAVVLTYAGLAVVDAAGRALDARLTLRGERLGIEIDERGALYPLTIDPTVQQAYVKASNSGASDQFGFSVSVSGNTVVVGAIEEDSNSTTIDAGQGDNSAAGAGAAYVFVRSGTSWSQQAYLKASNTDAGDQFGWSVSVSGNTAVVAAIGEDSHSITIDDGQASNGFLQAGAAYVFGRSGTVWSQEAYLKAYNTGAGDQFGQSVSISGDTIVVGAYAEDSNSTSINAGQGDNSAAGAGAAYVFVRSGFSWAQQAYLKASNTGAADEFGFTVSVSGDTVVVGARFEDSNSTAIDTGPGDNSAGGAGAAYVFVRGGTGWSQQAYLKASNTGAADNFGRSVSVSGDTAVVGALGEDSNSTTIDAGQGDNTSADAGAAYVFVRSGTAWSQQAYLKASNTGSNDLFGQSSSVSGDTVVVGAYFEDSNSTAIDAGQSDNSAGSAGAAYVFVRNGTAWSQRAYLKASNADLGDTFGNSVSVWGDTVVVGANMEDGNSTTIDTGHGDNTASAAGAAYVFFFRPAPVPYCFGDGSGTPCPCTPVPLVGDADKGCPNSFNVGGGKLTASGVASISGDTLLMTCTLINNGGAVVFQGTNNNGGGAGAVFGDGLRCASGAVMRMRSHAVITNSHQYPDPMFGDNAISIRGAVLVPGDRYYQGWYRSGLAHCNPTANYNLTNGVKVTWVP